MDEAIELAIEERDRNHGGLVRKFAYVSDAGHARFRGKRQRLSWVSGFRAASSICPFLVACHMVELFWGYLHGPRVHLAVTEERSLMRRPQLGVRQHTHPPWRPVRL